MRLHSLMVAASMSVPAVAVSYDVKIDNFISENRLGPCLNAAALDAEELYAAVTGHCINRASDPSFDETISELRKRCEVNSEQLFRLIDERTEDIE